MQIKEEFQNLFKQYKDEKGKKNLTYVITSADRQGNVNTNPHALSGNAIDLTLRVKGDYAPISEYNALLMYMVEHWPYRAGLDNTPFETQAGFKGNVHIHVDLGLNRPPHQALPFFFIEDNGKFLRQVFSDSDL